MSAQERAVRDLVTAKIGELRGEITRINAALAAIEKEVKSQPLTKPLEAKAPVYALEGWVHSVAESAAVIAMCCDRIGGQGTPSRLEDFARNLGMSLNNWRVQYHGTDEHGRPSSHVARPSVPAKTLTGHEDVRRILAARNGKPVEPTRYTGPQNVYPTGIGAQDLANERSKFVR